MRILLVEDDELLGEGTRKGLTQDGYTVDWVKDGALADQALKTEKFDLIVLDLGLPKYIFAVGSHWSVRQTSVSFL